MVQRSRWASLLLAMALAVLVGGGVLVGSALAAEHRERDTRNQVRVANHDLQLTVQARVDEARGDASLASVSAQDADLRGRIDELVRLDPGIRTQLNSLVVDEAVLLDEPGADDERDLSSVKRTLNRIEDDMLDAARAREDAAVSRTWWSFWSTGAALAALLLATVAATLRENRRNSEREVDVMR